MSWRHSWATLVMHLPFSVQGALSLESSSLSYIGYNNLTTTLGSQQELQQTSCGGNVFYNWSRYSFSPSPIAYHIYSSWGCGDIICWFQVPWTQKWLEVVISVKKRVLVMIAAGLWGPQWSAKHI